MFLDQVEQLFLGFEVVVEAGQRHTAGAREIAHGGAFVALFVKDFGGMGEDFRAADGQNGFAGTVPLAGDDAAEAGGPRWRWRQACFSNVRSNYTAGVIDVTRARDVWVFTARYLPARTPDLSQSRASFRSRSEDISKAKPTSLSASSLSDSRIFAQAAQDAGSSSLKFESERVGVPHAPSAG